MLWVKEKITQLVAWMTTLTSKKAYKLIAIDLAKPKVLSADPEVKQKISFTGNQDCAGSATEVFYIRKNKKKIF